MHISKQVVMMTRLIMIAPCLFLQDQWFWGVQDNSVVPGYPMLINYFWKGLPSKIDAIYENSEGKFVFFTSNFLFQLYLFTKGTMWSFWSHLSFLSYQ